MGTDTVECQRRGCQEGAVFLVREQYEEAGMGVVDSTARLCAHHASQEQPRNLDPASSEYLFEVRPLGPASQGTPADTTDGTEPTQCPDCGWTGTRSELAVSGGTRSCPVCGDDIGIVD
jgi:hypothetical protein